VPLLVASDDAFLVNTSSVNGFWACLGPNVAHTAYSTAKFAVKGFSEGLITDFRLNAPHVKVAVVMPGHIGTDIVENSRIVHGGGDPESMTDDELAQMRADLKRQGMPVDGVTDDQLRSGMKMMAAAFLDTAPTTAAQAASVILDGIRTGEWRILIGDDAKALDAAVRNDPHAAYDGGISLGALGGLAP
jgi:NAD(P)-dependent dehydrogenase (short-subunit alcohol dehydrogenase family)